jgi:hypothetical protein
MPHLEPILCISLDRDPLPSDDHLPQTCHVLIHSLAISMVQLHIAGYIDSYREEGTLFHFHFVDNTMFVNADSLRRLLEAKLLELDPRQCTGKYQATCYNDDPRLDVECIDVVCGVCCGYQCCRRAISIYLQYQDEEKAYWKG